MYTFVKDLEAKFQVNNHQLVFEKSRDTLAENGIADQSLVKFEPRHVETRVVYKTVIRKASPI
jgi:hypothetical protein